MKLIAVVTEYFCDINELSRNINSYINAVDKLVIWVNTPGADAVNEISEHFDNPKIEVISTGENEYLAKPFNQIIGTYSVEGFTHLLTMDQDSFFAENAASLLRQKIASDSTVNTGIYIPFVDLGGGEKPFTDEIKFAYTSGSVFPLSVFAKCGYFREDLAMYTVDIEFSFRVRKQGFKITRYSDVILHHKMGYAKKNKLGFVVNNYSASSTYYILRNTILLWKEYPSEFTKRDKYFLLKYKVLFRLLKLIFEDNRIKKTKAILLGLIHGLFNRSGLYSV